MLIKRLFNKETIVESVGIVTIFTVLQRIIQLGRGVVFARLLGPKEYGVYTLAFFFIPLVVTFAKLGIPSCFSRYIPQYEKKRSLRDFLKKTYLIVIGSSIFVALVCFMNAQKLSGIIYGSSIYYKIIIISSLIIVPYGIFEALMASFQGQRVFKTASILKFSQFFIFTVLGIVLVIFSRKAESVILANLISFIIVVLFFSFIFRRYLAGLDSQGSVIKERDFYKKIFNFSIWFVITPVVYTLFTYTDRWMLTRFMGLSHAGIYSVATNISGLIFTFGMIIGNVLTPNLSEYWENGSKQKAVYMLNFATKANTLLLLAGGVVLFLFKAQIVTLLYGEAYVECIPVVGMLLIFWLFNSIPWTIGSYAHLIEKTHIRFVCSSAALVSNLCLNYILIPRYGLMGAAIATAGSSLVMLITMLSWFWIEGLKLKPGTIFVCTLPLIFMFDNSFIVSLLFLVLIGVVLKTDFIINADEKSMLIAKCKDLKERLCQR